MTRSVSNQPRTSVSRFDALTASTTARQIGLAAIVDTDCTETRARARG